MNCQDINEILDDYPIEHLTVARRKEVESHLASCSVCENAWTTQLLIVEQPIPTVRQGFLEEVMELLPSIETIPARRRPRPATLLLGGTFAAGALLAAVSWIGDRNESGESTTVPALVAPVAPPPSPADFVARAEQSLQSSIFPPEQIGILPDGNYFSLLQIAPPYPPEALEENLEGYVIVEFTITQRGFVSNAVVVESSDEIFESAAIEAVQGFKYKPRVSDGVPVDVPGVRNMIRFAVDHADSQQDVDNDTQVAPPSRARFREAIAPAVACIESNDLVCAELVLDEIIATFDLNPNEAFLYWRVYGYVHFMNQNFERAIAAYETSVSQPGIPEYGGRITLAHVYYERRQYQRALEVMIDYLELSKAEPWDSIHAFVERLRALGARVPR